MKILKIIFPIFLILLSLLSLVYAEQQKSRTSNYQEKITELKDSLRINLDKTNTLRYHAQQSAAQARIAMNRAESEVQHAKRLSEEMGKKIRTLEASLATCQTRK